MTPERWQQIEQLYHDSLEEAPEHRFAFLTRSCRGDDDLMREVESLLASHAVAANFIESPPDELAARMIFERQEQSMIGRTLGHYRIESLIGAGGMGEVYRAVDTRLGAQVAIKVLAPHLTRDEDALLRFKREVRAASAISHPNVLSIQDFGTEGGVAFAVTELLAGETLRSRLKRSQISWREAITIVIEVAEGLSAAHAQQIIHRDLKPENIFLTRDGPVKVLDFGIARVKQDATKLGMHTASFYYETKPGIVLGTRGYASPEQLVGKPVEAPGDIFSLGCVLSEMVGRRCPAELKQVIAKCLEIEHEERYQTADELVMILKVIRNLAIASEKNDAHTTGAESK